jgi:methyl-accepting chemotaxis protein
MFGLIGKHIPEGFRQRFFSQKEIIADPADIGIFDHAAEDDPPVSEVIPKTEAMKISARILGLASDLKACVEASEPEFLQLGNELQTLYSEATALTQKTMDAVGDYGESSENHMLSDVVNLARESLSELKTDRVQIVDNLKSVDSIREKLDALCKKTTIIGQISKSLKMIGLNINIESARFEEARELFEVLAQEISGLSNTVGGIGRTIRGDSESGVKNLNGFHIKMQQNMSQLEKFSHDAEAELNIALPAVESILEFSMNILDRSRKHSGDISKQIGDIVVGIQIHDNIRQRVEHIAVAIEEAEAYFTTSKPEDLSSMESMGMAYSIIQLQLAQLQKLTIDVVEVHESSVKAFEGLQGTVKEISLNLNSIDNNDSIHSGPHSSLKGTPIEALKSALEHIYTLLNEGTEKLLQVNQATDQSAKATDRLLDHMDNIRVINFDIHLKALNAIANSVRLGAKGKAIAVIVQEMKESASRSNDFAEEVDQIIQDITDATRSMKDKADTDNFRENKVSQTRENLHGEMKKFTDAFGNFTDTAKSIPQISRVLESKIINAKNNLGFFKGLSKTFDKHRGHLEEVVNTLAPWAAQAQESGAVDLDEISSRYTMDQERGVHDEIFGISGGSENTMENSIANESEPVEMFSATDAMENDGDSEDQAFGDNVELF